MTQQQRKKEVIDPVCGMNVADLTDMGSVSHKGETFSFCNAHCRERFTKTPDKFLKEPLIKLKNIWKVFLMGDTETQVLRDLSLHIWEGDFVAIIGASGSGKSTALNMIGLLDRPTSGDIFFRGKNVLLLEDIERAELRSKTFGFVFQHYNLIPWLTAYENVTLPNIFARRKINQGKMHTAFKKIGLQERMTHRPFELSGGEQQRVALLRSLSNDPRIIIGDEPTGNLDSKTGDVILDLLIELHKEQKKTLLIVTHDEGIAEKANHVVVLKDGRMIRHHKTQKKIYTE